MFLLALIGCRCYDEWNTFFFFHLTSSLIKRHNTKRNPAFDQKLTHHLASLKKICCFIPKTRLEVFGKYAAVQRAFKAKKKKRFIHCKFPLSSCLFESSDIPWASWDADETPVGGNEEHGGLREESANAVYDKINWLNYGCFLLMLIKMLWYNDTTIRQQVALCRVGVRRRRKWTDDTKWHWSGCISWWKSKQAANSRKYRD